MVTASHRLCGERCLLQVTVSAPWDKRTEEDDRDGLKGQLTSGSAEGLGQ